YECGIEAPTTAFDYRFSARYFLIAVLFVVFDVETIFLFPWAILLDKLALFGFVEMLVFIAILVVGYFYAWKRGALQWASGSAPHARPRQPVRRKRPHHARRFGLQLGAAERDLADAVRPRVLRDRDDGGDGLAPRPRPVRRGGLPRHASPVGPDDRRRD